MKCNSGFAADNDRTKVINREGAVSMNKQLRNRFVITGLLCLGLLGYAVDKVAADSPAGCTIAGGAGPVLSMNIFSGNPTTNGGTVVYQAKYFNDPSGILLACDWDNVTITFTCPDATGSPNGSSTVLETGLSIPDNTLPVNLPLQSCVINVGAASAATAKVSAVGTLLSSPPVAGQTDIRLLPVQVVHPNICITKQCQNGSCEDGIITFNGTVINCGDVPLGNITVSDQVDGNSVVVTNVTGPLAAGGSFTYSGSYVATQTPSTDFVTVVGTMPTAPLATVSATTNATCSVSGTPNITLDKNCIQSVPGATISFSGTAKNTGSVTLFNVTITDSKAGLVQSCGTLAPQGTCTYSGSYLPVSCPDTNTARVDAVTSVLCGSVPVSAEAHATCGTGAALIKVNKDCFLTGDCDTPTVTFTGTVQNTGSVVLTNVTVVDQVAGLADVLVFGPSSLSVGEVGTFSGTYLMQSSPSTDTVVAVGTGAAVPQCGGTTVTDSKSCRVPISGVPCIHVTKNCAFGDSAATNIVISGVVSNCSSGGITLLNVTVSDDVAGPVLGPITLAQGGSQAYTGSYAVSLPACPPGFNSNFADTVTARGEDHTICALAAGAAGGERVVTATANCNISTNCQPPAVPGCRTTGGGKQPGAGFTCPVVAFVTHGGQIGAPFAQASAPDCTTGLGFNNPCIRGEYQYIRHGSASKKGGKPFHFHAASNGRVHDYDALLCACLPCDHADVPSPFGGCHPADRTYLDQDPTVPGKHFGLCNPGDRVCGPEPRKAPANKLASSGATTKADQPCVFRIDIEDRSEPGGAHPKGGTPPPDRFRIRLWFVPSGMKIDSPAMLALRDAVAPRDPLTEAVETTLPCGQMINGSTAVPAPDIDDGGDLDRGNRQIHPVTGANSKCQ